jgi:hypothetical protein
VSALQTTRFQRFSAALGGAVIGQLRGSWKHRSAVLLALLVGFYAGGNITAYVELLVRLRGRLVISEPPLLWRVLDNLRIGLVYAVVLEAYKLGT